MSMIYKKTGVEWRYLMHSHFVGWQHSGSIWKYQHLLFSHPTSHNSCILAHIAASARASVLFPSSDVRQLFRSVAILAHSHLRFKHQGRCATAPWQLLRIHGRGSCVMHSSVEMSEISLSQLEQLEENINQWWDRKFGLGHKDQDPL